MQIERSPLLRLDQTMVLGYLKSAGTRDPEIMHTHKANLMSLAKFPKFVGTYLIVLGGLCTIMVLTAVIGIPLLFFGFWMRKRGVNNIKTVEAGWKEFASAAA
jgi:hypothetical protein